MQRVVSAGVLPRVLLIADRPGWAIERKALNLQRTLADRFECVIRFQHAVDEADLASSDLVLVFYWLETLKMAALPAGALERHADRLVMGICSHFELEGERRAPGLAMLDRLPRAVFANSRLLRDEYAPLLRVPVHVTPNGVDTAFFRPPSPPRVHAAGELRVGWAGSLSNMGPAQRGFHDVIEPALAAVPGATLVTAIREQHWRSADEMLAFYCGLDVYVCASRSEGTPNPCLEAAACGLPIVSTAVGNMPELVEHGENGYLYDGSVAALAAHLSRLRDAPALTRRLGERMRASIAAWDWRHQSENYARLFDAVLGARR